MSLQLTSTSSTNSAASTTNRVAWFSLGTSTSVQFFAQGQAYGYITDSSNTPGPFSSFSNFQFAIYYIDGSESGETEVFGPGIQYATPSLTKNPVVIVEQIKYIGSDTSISTDSFYAIAVDLGYDGSYYYDTMAVAMNITGTDLPTDLTLLGWSNGGDYPTDYTSS